MKIDNSKSIKDIQKEFSNLYPGLKIEFYKSKHRLHEGSKKLEQYEPNILLADIRSKHDSGEIDMNNQKTVSELESLFEEQLGLHVQVFRRSGNLWLQTTTTDGWTLETQNRKGLHSVEALSPGENK